MKTQETTTHNIKHAYSGSLAFTLVSIIAVVVFAFPTTAWSQTAEWTVYNTVNSGLPYNGVTALAIDAQGTVWVGTGRWYAFAGGGLAKFDGENWTVYNTSNSELPNNDHISLSIDAQGNIWSGTESGLSKFDGENWTVYLTNNSGLPNNQTGAPVFDAEGNAWIGTSNGLARFDGANWTVYNTGNSGLPNNFIWPMAFDAQGNLWIGTFSGDLAKFDGANWTVYKASNSGLPGSTIASLCIDEQGNVWIGTYGGVVKFDGANWIVYNTVNSGLPNNRIWNLAVDAQGNIWAATDGGLAKYDGLNWTVYNMSNSGLPDNNVYSLAFDAQGNLWIGTESGGLAVYHPLPQVDLNADEKVNFKDFSMLAQYWFQDQPPFSYQRVDYEYLAVLAENWLADFRLVAHWNLDETEGNIAYDSIGDKNGTLYGQPLWQPAAGRIDGALQLDGNDDYISTNFALGSSVLSFSTFVWVKGGAPGQVIISQMNYIVGRTAQPGSTWLGTDSSDGKLITRLMDVPYGPLESEAVITDGQWHQVAVVYDFDGFCRSLYVDGAEVAKDETIVAGLLSPGSLRFGADKDLSAGSFFSGLIDDIRIYTMALSAKEIEELVR